MSHKALCRIKTTMASLTRREYNKYIRLGRTKSVSPICSMSYKTFCRMKSTTTASLTRRECNKYKWLGRTKSVGPICSAMSYKTFCRMKITTASLTRRERNKYKWLGRTKSVPYAQCHTRHFAEWILLWQVWRGANATNTNGLEEQRVPSTLDILQGTLPNANYHGEFHSVRMLQMWMAWKNKVCPVCLTSSKAFCWM
jgi:hypothetical protein